MDLPQTRTVRIGNIAIGGNHPLLLQSMTNTNTLDTRTSVDQCIRLFDAGAGLVRLTTQGIREAENLVLIKKELRSRGYDQPLAADVHFNPAVAEVAARLVEKVRINPGNYADKKQFRHIEFTDAGYREELERIHQRLLPLLTICKEYGTAIRIGVNHGSLSDRIMSRYGDTPEGMVESAMEFLRICRSEGFDRIVLSLKASNVRVMVYANRLLMQRMKGEGEIFPLHLGVTEAGEGEDGRIRSAAGIGALLAEGIGDTIRVSLTGDPVNELPVARQLATLAGNRDKNGKTGDQTLLDPFTYERRTSDPVLDTGGKNLPVIIADSGSGEWEGDSRPEYLFLTQPSQPGDLDEQQKYICDIEPWQDRFRHQANVYPLVPAWFFFHWRKTEAGRAFLLLEPQHLSGDFMELLKMEKNTVLVLQTFEPDPVNDLEHAFRLLQKAGIRLPVIVNRNYAGASIADLQVQAAAETAVLFIDGLADGIWLRNVGDIASAHLHSVSMGILQACRMRSFRTEYISCPSCGRTLFDIVEVLRRVKEKTFHLSHLKIAVMGCIVNGPGEMADADYGYVGAGPGKVTLYKGKEIVRSHIPQEQALEQLIEVIKESGDWKEPATKR